MRVAKHRQKYLMLILVRVNAAQDRFGTDCRFHGEEQTMKMLTMRAQHSRRDLGMVLANLQ